MKGPNLPICRPIFFYSIGRVWYLAWNVFPSGLLYINIFLQLSSALLSFSTTYVTADIVGSVLDGDTTRALRWFSLALLTYIGFAISLTLAAATGEQLRAAMRGALSSKLLSLYMTGNVPFALSIVGKNLRENQMNDQDILSSQNIMYDNDSNNNNVHLLSDTTPMSFLSTPAFYTPDQQATLDCESLAIGFCEILFGNYSSPNGLVSILISTFLSIFLLSGFGPVPSGWPIFLAFLFACIGALLLNSLASMISTWEFTTDETFGKLRTYTASLSVAAEEISIWKGQNTEMINLSNRLYAYIHASIMKTLWHWLFSFFQGIQGSYPTLLGFLSILVILIIDGNSYFLSVQDDNNNNTLDPTTIALVSSVTASLTTTLCTFPNIWARVASLRGAFARIDYLWRACESTHKLFDIQPTSGKCIDNSTTNKEIFELIKINSMKTSDLDVAMAIAKNTAMDICNTVKHYETEKNDKPWNINIYGPSGIGKTLCVRLLSGFILLNSPLEIHTKNKKTFSQRIYLPPSSLLQGITGSAWITNSNEKSTNTSIITYQKNLLSSLLRASSCDPVIEKEILYSMTMYENDTSWKKYFKVSLPFKFGEVENSTYDSTIVIDHITSILASLNLSHIIPSSGGLALELDWKSFLSKGEQSRLALARILFNHPSIAILDEPFASLDEASENLCRQALQKAKVSSIIFSHNPGSDVNNDMDSKKTTFFMGENIPSLLPKETHLPKNQINRQETKHYVASRFESTPTINGSQSEVGAALIDSLKLFWLYGLPSFQSKSIFSKNHTIVNQNISFFLCIVSLVGSISSIIISLNAPAAYGELFSSVLSGDTTRAWQALSYAVFLYTLSTFLSATTRAVGEILSLAWYSRIVTKIGTMYLKESKIVPNEVHPGWEKFISSTSNLYRVQKSSDILDAMDQRLIGDPSTLVKTLGPLFWGGGLILPLLQVLGTIIAASVKVALAYGPLPLIGSLAYTIAGLIITRFLLSGTPAPAIALNAAEGLLRSIVQRVAASPEEAVSSGILNAEAARAHVSLTAVIASSISLTFAQLRSRIFSSSFNYCASIASYAMTAMALSWGIANSDLATDFYTLLGLLTSLNMYAASLPGILSRAGEGLGSATRVMQTIKKLSEVKEFDIVKANDEYDILTNVPVETNAVLIVSENLFHYSDRHRFSSATVMCTISAPSGSGKSSMLRSIAGISDFTSAFLFYRSKNVNGTNTTVLFSPQFPYWPYGATLSDAIVYPKLFTSQQVHLISNLLSKVGLSRLIPNIQSMNFSLDSLSGGERQRLIIARILYHKPDVAILDEPFSALDATSTAELLNVLSNSRISCFILQH